MNADEDESPSHGHRAMAWSSEAPGIEPLGQQGGAAGPSGTSGSLLPARPPTNRWAIASLISAILGFTLLFAFVPSVVAVVLGHLAHYGINRSQPRQKGKRYATIGLVLGYGQIAIFAMLLASLMVYAVLSAYSAGVFDASACPSERRMVEEAAQRSVLDGNRPTDVYDLVEQGYLPTDDLVGMYDVEGAEVTRIACPLD